MCRGRVCRGGNKFSLQYSCDSYYFLNGFEMLLDVGNSLSWFLMINLRDSQTRILEIRTTFSSPLNQSLSEVKGTKKFEINFALYLQQRINVRLLIDGLQSIFSSIGETGHSPKLASLKETSQDFVVI